MKRMNKDQVLQAEEEFSLREKRLKFNQDKVWKDAEDLPDEVQHAAYFSKKLVDEELEKVNKDFIDIDNENRIRKSGYLPSQAEQIAEIAKTKNVGEVFLWSEDTLNIEEGQKKKVYSCGGKFLVKTPFSTVVDAQIYLSALENKVLELSELNTSKKEVVKTKMSKLKSKIKKLIKKG